MKNIALLALLLASLFTNAQYCARDYTDEQFQRFLGARLTYVQKSGDVAFDSVFDAVMAKYWTLGKYKLISAKKIASERSNPDYAFLLPLGYQQVNYLTKDTFFSNSVQALIMGGKSDISTSDFIAFAHTDYKQINSGEGPGFMHMSAEARGQGFSGLAFRLIDVIKGINDAVELVKKEKSSFRPGIMSGISYMNKKFYNKHMDVLKSKTLYVYFSNVNSDFEKLRKAYPYKIEFVGKEDFFEVVAGNKPNAAYMVLTNTSGLDALIITDAETHKCLGGLTFGYVTNIDAGDFRDLAKEVKATD
jgi:hypothetical protein